MGDKASMSHPGHVLGLNKRKEYDLPHRVKRRRSRLNEFGLRKEDSDIELVIDCEFDYMCHGPMTIRCVL